MPKKQASARKMSFNECRAPGELILEGNVAKNWQTFKQKFEIYLEASNKVELEDKKKVAILLNLAGDKALEVYNTFKFTRDEEKNKLDKILHMFEEYCSPRKNIVYERFVFFNTTQKEGQSFDSFLTELKKNAATCEFDGQEESLIRDRIVFGIKDKATQERLLREPNLDLGKAANFCRAVEASKTQFREMEATGGTIVDAVAKGKEKFMKSARKNAEKEKRRCSKCDGNHEWGQCPAYGKLCAICKNKNHFARVCRTKKRNPAKTNKVHEVETEIDLDEEGYFIDTLFIETVEETQSNAWYEKIVVENKVTLRFKLDTGASCNIIPLNEFNKIAYKGLVNTKENHVVAYGNHKIKTFGSVKLNVKVREKNVQAKFIIVNLNSEPLLGLETCVELGLINRINSMDKNTTKQKFIDKNRDIFLGIGKIPGEYKIVLKDGTIPVINPPRRVPESIKPKLIESLAELEDKNIIEKVDYPTDWVNNITIVEKPNGKLRVCLDPRELNKCIKLDQFPIPTVNDIELKLGGKSLFTVLDMKDGFFQVELDEASSLLTTFITPFGKYKFKRLPFGLNVSPEVFQRYNTKIFGDLNIGVYFDDCIIGAANEKEHDIILQKVLDRARQNNIKFNKDKLQYRVPKVKYLGQIFSAKGVEPDNEHVKAILEMSEPQNKTELQTFLGMVSYLGKFIPNLSSRTSILRELIKNNNEWVWTADHTKSFHKLKALISSAPVLKIFDGNLPIDIYVDASQSGIGGCLLQRNHPVSFCSRALTETEKNYSQIEKEYLSICFAVTKFHQYIYGRNITVYTDHKPLVTIHNKSIQKITSRLQRMKLKLIRYNIDIKHVSGKDNVVADLLSRNYLKDQVFDDPSYKEIVHCLDKELAMSATRIKQFQTATQNDECMQEIINFINNNWPNSVKQIKNKEAREYFKIRNELTFKDNLVFLHNKVVVPKSLRDEMLKILHEPHLGIEKTKSNARQVMYWPRMSANIENLITNCSTCQKYLNKNIKEPLLPHAVPDGPFQKVCADIGHFQNDSYLVLVDYYSKWLEVVKLENKTTTEIISKLKKIFSTHGIPLTFMSDNMPFNSYEFKEFARAWNFNLVTSSPLYPQSNGLAEKGVGIAKKLLKKSAETNTDFDIVLLGYRNYPLKGTKCSPAEILFSRKLRTKLPITKSQLKPKVQTDIKTKLQQNQQKQKYYYDRQAVERPQLNTGDTALLRNPINNTWRKVIVESKCKTPRSYIVKDKYGNQYRRNSSFLRKCKDSFIMDYDDLNMFNENNVEKTNNTAINNDVDGKENSVSYNKTRYGRKLNKPKYLQDYV